MPTKSKQRFAVSGRTVVITGGSQGMGRGLGKHLSHQGANVVLVARNVEKLREAVDVIKKLASKPSSQRFHYISADVSIPEENERIIAEVTAWNHDQPPDIVWANAGFAAPSLFLDTSVETLRSQMDINYFAAAYLARATLKAWLAASPAPPPVTAKGTPLPHLPYHFIMTSSSAAFVGVAGYAPYSPAKAAMRNLHDVLRSELNLYNGARRGNAPELKVHTVFPGTILSPGFQQENKTKHPVTRILEEGDPAQGEDEVAGIAIEQLKKGRSLITTQIFGAGMRASSLGGSPRDRWFVDTFMASVMNPLWLFIAPDMEKKVYMWGRRNGAPNHTA